jgi:hypothetical protein
MCWGAGARVLTGEWEVTGKQRKETRMICVMMDLSRSC